MAVPKFKKYYQLMVSQNQKMFDTFLATHNNFVMDQETYATQFHTEGRDVLDMIRFWERKLCSGMEKGNNSQYSSKLAEKFWEEVRKQYSHIDQVGVQITKTST